MFYIYHYWQQRVCGLASSRDDDDISGIKAMVLSRLLCKLRHLVYPSEDTWESSMISKNWKPGYLAIESMLYGRGQ